MKHRLPSLKPFKIYFFVLLFFFSCKENIKNNAAVQDSVLAPAIYSHTEVVKSTDTHNPVTDSLEFYFKEMGLANIREGDSTIQVELKYSTRDNFLGEDVYGNLEDAYLQAEVAEKLIKASSQLKKIAPGHRLIVYDAVRPVSVQWKMWNLLKMPVHKKVNYVSNPAEGSLHNYGAAVDLSIMDAEGNVLDMGTPYDYFGVLAYPEKEDSLLRAGALQGQQVKNRKLLRTVMHKAGFFGIQSEWWHFNSCIRDSAKAKYKLVR